MALRFGDYDAWNDAHHPRAVGAVVNPDSEGGVAAGWIIENPGEVGGGLVVYPDVEG